MHRSTRSHWLLCSWIYPITASHNKLAFACRQFACVVLLLECDLDSYVLDNLWTVCGSRLEVKQGEGCTLDPVHHCIRIWQLGIELVGVGTRHWYRPSHCTGQHGGDHGTNGQWSSCFIWNSHPSLPLAVSAVIKDTGPGSCQGHRLVSTPNSYIFLALQP